VRAVRAWHASSFRLQMAARQLGWQAERRWSVMADALRWQQRLRSEAACDRARIAS